MELIDKNALESDIFLAEELPVGTSVILLADVLNASTIDAAPVVRGKWTRAETTEEKHRCSHCGYVYYPATKLMHNYCPNCGANMKGEIL